MPRQKKDNIKILVDGMEEVIKSIKDLTGRIEKLESPPVLETKPIETPSEQISEDMIPVPSDYRKIVDTVLNPNFGIKVAAFADRPEIEITIIVPEQYSNMSKEYKEMQKVDLRSKIISRAEGVNGVQLWAEKVYKNLRAEIQAQISADRIKLLNQ